MNTLTGHAEIDQQHKILENMVPRLEVFCCEANRSPEVSCIECDPEKQQECTDTLLKLTQELMAFVIGHTTYEEKMMELLRDCASCQTHIKLHKAAHADIVRKMKQISAQIGRIPPRVVSFQLWKMAGDWLGEHTIRFDQRLVRFGKNGCSEIDFDAELVSMLDKHVFLNRPTVLKSSAGDEAAIQQQQLEMRGRFESLSPAQNQVFWLIVSGKKNSEIARDLGITINTVKTHRSAVFQKMGANSAVDLLKKTDSLRYVYKQRSSI